MRSATGRFVKRPFAPSAVPVLAEPVSLVRVDTRVGNVTYWHLTDGFLPTLMFLRYWWIYLPLVHRLLFAAKVDAEQNLGLRVGGVLVGVAFVIDLLQCFICALIELEFKDVDVGWCFYDAI